MALSENGGGVSYSMPVAPAANYGGGFGFGDSWSWIIILLLFGMFGGWGGGFGGGMWGMDGGFGLYPWLNNSQNINDGFRDQMITTNLNGIQSSITSGFGDVQNSLCGGFAGVTAAVNGAQNALAQQLYTNQMADMERSFAVQSALQNCCCENRAATADLKYTVATEACADRAAIAEALQKVIASSTADTQRILDKMCQQENEALKTKIIELQNQVNLQALAASQTA